MQNRPAHQEQVASRGNFRLRLTQSRGGSVESKGRDLCVGDGIATQTILRV